VSDPIPLKLTVAADDATLKDLDQMRRDLYAELETNQMDVEEPETTRSLDPVMVGSLAMALLPVAVLNQITDVAASIDDYLKKFSR